MVGQSIYETYHDTFSSDIGKNIVLLMRQNILIMIEKDQERLLHTHFPNFCNIFY